ncbi:MAG TPA: methionyl-tRNA formyltransferase [Thermoleophilaceae bacterium]
MRTVYLGTSDFAVSVLDRLADSPHRPVLVVTRPDRPRGRGRRLSPPPVAEAARALGIETIQPESVNSDEARAAISAAEPESVCICAYGALIKEPLLSEHPMLNVHPSLLPRWRGAAPIERSIDAGDEETGVSIMRPIMEMDAGPVCLQRVEPIEPGDDFGSLSARLAKLGGELLVEALDTRPPFEEQTEDGVTIAPKIGPDDRRLDGSLDAAAAARRVRALNPHVGTFLELPDGERLGVRRAAVAAEPGEALPGGAAPRPGDSPPPGAVAAVDGRLLYGCADGPLEMIEVQPAGGRPMDAAAYLRGHGARLAG